ncbi:MAG: ABC transporter substrate-binding protein [Proteobacteria bacterium]|nr:ABC transporter substrate-binding protein [Pseudomonadota bacterium]
MLMTVQMTFRALAAVVLLTWLPVGQAAGQTSVLKTVPEGDLKVLDPIFTTGSITQAHAGLIFDQLFGLDERYQPKPQMVDTWTVSPDSLVYTFTLRPGLAFHDGDPVRAADAVASLERWGKKDIMGQRLYQSVAKVEAIDDRTLKMTLKEPYGLLLNSIGRMGGLMPFIMKEKYAKTDPGTQVTEMIGSGPFMFKKEEWVPGSKVVYAKNPNYKPRSEPPSGFAGGKVAKVDRVEWLYIPDAATASAALQAGEIDMWEWPTSDFVALLKKDPKIVIANYDPLGQVGIMRPNFLHPPFDNPKARQALLWLTVQLDYRGAIVGGDPTSWIDCVGMFSCGGPNATNVAATPLMEPDRSKKEAMAKRLLAEAGYKGEPIYILEATDLPELNASALVLADQLKRIGAKPELVPLDWNSILTRRANKKPPAEGGWNIFITTGTGLGTSDPFANSVSTACEKAWFGWPCDAEIERLRDAWTREPDPTKQKAIVEQLQTRMFEFVPYVPFGQWAYRFAYRANVKGVLSTPTRAYWNTSKE